VGEILNPYIAGAPVVERSMFFGRQDVFDWIERSLAGQYVNNILVIHGQRRVGKTSVLKQIPHHLSSKYIQVFFDLQGRTNTTLDRFLWWLAREISRTLRQECGLIVDVPEQSAFREDGDPLQTQFLPGVWPLLAEKSLLLTFDEFDALDQPEIQETLARPLIDYLRRLFDHEKLSFIFSIGSSGHKLENMQAAYTNFFKSALYRKISFLVQEDCRQLITRPVDGVLTYHPDAIDRIYLATAGHPYFTQLMCHELFSVCQKTGRRSVDPGDVEAILEDVIERGTVNLKFVWDEASPLEKWVLACLAQADRGASDLQLAGLLNSQRVRYSESDLNRALLHLREKDVLTQENGFVVSLMRLWLQKNRPLERVREELVEVNPIANRYIEIGEEYQTLGDRRKAQESFQQALLVDPGNLKARLHLGAIHLEAGELDQALQAYEAALAIDLEDVKARTGFCSANMALGDQASVDQDIDKAEQFYRQVLSINADHTEARQRLTAIYSRNADQALEQGRDEAALYALREALQHSPEDAALEARLREVETQKLEKTLQAALEESRREASAHRWEAAASALEGALEIAPDDSRLQQAFELLKANRRVFELKGLASSARSLADAGRWEEAAETWRAYLALEPEDAEAVRTELEQIGLRLELDRLYAQALGALEDKDYPRAVGLLKRVVFQDESYKNAARLLAQAIEAQRARRSIWRIWSRLYAGSESIRIEAQRARRPVWSRWIRAVAAGLTFVVLVWAGFRFGPGWLRSLSSQPPLLPSTQMIDLTAPPTSPAAFGGSPTQLPAESPQPAQTGLLIGFERFAGPILESIRGVQPDFEDDFSSHKPEWDPLPGPPGAVEIATEGVEGQMALVPSRGARATVSGDHISAGDFVLEFDFQFDVEQGATNPVFEITFGSGCRFWIELTDPRLTGNPGYVWKASRESGLSIGQGYADSLDPSSYNAFRFLNSADEFAIYLRGEPLTHFWDRTCTGDENAFSVRADEEQFKFVLDNLKFWDLSPAWVKDFANPALRSIVDAPPDFEDDFSSQKPEWGDPPPPGVRIAGDPHNNLVLNTKDNADIRAGGEHLSAEDFVLQYDISNFSLGSDTRNPTHKLLFGDSVDGQGCSFGLTLDVRENGEEATYYWDVTDREDQIIVQGSTGIFNADPLRLNETIVIINQSDEYGIFLNEEPLVYFQEEGCAGPVSFGALAQGALELILDNIKFWTLGPHPVEDFTGPVLQSVAEVPPDFEDDFSSRRPEWETFSRVEFLKPENVMRFRACLFAWAGGGALDAEDFILQFDFKKEDPKQSGVLTLRFRSTSDIGPEMKYGGYVFDLPLSENPGGIEWKLSWEGGDAFLTGATDAYRDGETNQFVLVVLGDRYAVILNDSLVVAFRGNDSSGDKNIIRPFSDQCFTLDIDNLKLWKLEPEADS